MHSTIFPLTWDLESVFKNKGQGDALSHFLKKLHHTLDALKRLIEQKAPLPQAIALSQNASEYLAEAASFVCCLLAEDTTDAYSLKLQGEITSLQAELDTLLILVDEKLKALDQKSFALLLQDPLCQNLSFPLKERKILTEQKLSCSLESMISHLSIDGYHGYSQLFYILHGTLKFPMPDAQGNTHLLSTGQIDNQLAHPDRAIRSQAFHLYKQTFKDHEAPFAAVLNHIAGFRLQVYAKRGWHDTLDEPLTCNRMQKATLDTMWEVINDNLSPFVAYLEKKASLFGLQKLSWHDVDIPVTCADQALPYQEASEFIVEQFQSYSPKMAQFARRALQQGWIEAEDRKNKSAGGFCVGLPLKKESRIFMTYSGTQNNLTTLAHELGHAYHNEIIFSHPYFAQNIKMNVAETASTMAEMIVADAALQTASTPDKKLALLDDKLSRSVVFFMNIQARFLFETAFYKERTTGYVLPSRLCTLMEEAQQKAFRHTLSEWHPHFWASKMHFYSTEVPFYNFPYTFGYLFSLGIYTLLKKDKKSFEKKYDALLYDTPLMTSEDLAKKHFNVNLSQKTFWQLAMEAASQDVQTFFSLTT